MIILTICQSEWREPQTCRFLSLTIDYFDNFPVCLEGAPDLSTSFFHWGSPRTEMLYLGPPHKQKCFTWDSPTNRNALPGTPPRTEMLYLGLPTNRNALPGTPPRTEMLYQAAKNPQKPKKTKAFQCFSTKTLKTLRKTNENQ